MDPNIDTYPIIDMYPKGPIMKKTTVGMPIFVVGQRASFTLFLCSSRINLPPSVRGRSTNISVRKSLFKLKTGMTQNIIQVRFLGPAKLFFLDFDIISRNAFSSTGGNTFFYLSLKLKLYRQRIQYDKLMINAN